LKGHTLPVEHISWEEAASYCGMIGGRLPTEARAGNRNVGSGGVGKFAWFGGNSEKMTHNVGQKEPNAWGLVDTLGNVWEWVSDPFAFYSGPSGNPQDPSNNGYRTIRGGAWYDDARFVRPSYRTAVVPQFTGWAGVRCVSD
jgi:formylglycine-generating enzyme required for sulfatase activity